MADRLIAQDTSTLTIDTGTDLLDLATSWEITSTRTMIDVSPFADDFDTTREGSYNYRLRIEKLIETDGVLFDAYLTGGPIAWKVKCASTADAYSGFGVITECSHTSGGRNGRQVEAITITGTGELVHSVNTPSVSVSAS